MFSKYDVYNFPESVDVMDAGDLDLDEPDRTDPLSWDPKTVFEYPVNIIAREAWGALPTKEPPVQQRLPLRLVYFTYSNTDQCSTRRECTEIVKQLQRKHMEDGHNDIFFSFLVGGDGNIYEGAGWDKIYEPSRPEYDIDDPKAAIAFIRRGEDDEDVASEKLIWRGSDFLDWAYPMKYFY